MSTKTELEEQLVQAQAKIKELTVEKEALAKAAAERDALQARIEALAVEKEALAQDRPERCINCGQSNRRIQIVMDVEGEMCYYCPVCDHRWTIVQEQAPFRRLQRGEVVR